MGCFGKFCYLLRISDVKFFQNVHVHRRTLLLHFEKQFRQRQLYIGVQTVRPLYFQLFNVFVSGGKQTCRFTFVVVRGEKSVEVFKRMVLGQVLQNIHVVGNISYTESPFRKGTFQPFAVVNYLPDVAVKQGSKKYQCARQRHSVEKIIAQHHFVLGIRVVCKVDRIRQNERHFTWGRVRIKYGNKVFFGGNFHDGNCF